MISPPRLLAERHFRAASGKAALFELRIRLIAGRIPAAANLKINTKLSVILSKVLKHYKTQLTQQDGDVLMQAKTTRDKLLHCEFSATRITLNERNHKTRRGGVVRVDIAGLGNNQILKKISDLAAGRNVGQTPVSNTSVKAHKDIFGWLLESQSAGEFQEAQRLFKEAMMVLNKLLA